MASTSTGRLRPRLPSSQATSLYHPDTVERSLRHDGTGPEPGFKDPDGNWDLRPHAGRIVTSTDETLAHLARGPRRRLRCPIRQTRMVYTVNRAVAEVLDQPGPATPRRVARAGVLPGWDEKIDRKKGFFESALGRARTRGTT